MTKSHKFDIMQVSKHSHGAEGTYRESFFFAGLNRFTVKTMILQDNYVKVGFNLYCSCAFLGGVKIRVERYDRSEQYGIMKEYEGRSKTKR